MRSPLTALLLLAACGGGGPAPLEVFAAASLRGAAEDLARAWEAHGGRPVRLRFAGSGTLSRQLLAVAAGDLFLSADEVELDRLAARGRIAPDGRRPLAGNVLVVIAHPGVAPGPDFSAADLADQARVAMGDPDAVPAGRYARAWLEGLGLWERVRPRVAATTNVRAALALVAAGAAPVGIVYRTDAALTERVVVVLEAGQGPQVRYGAALLDGAHPEARALLEWLGTAQARAILARHGFLPPPEGD